MLDINKEWVQEYVLARSTNLHGTLPKTLRTGTNRRKFQKYTGESPGYIGRSSVDFLH